MIWIYVYRILALAIVLGVIVLVHEWGHFIAARLMKVRVEIFSFGFGKRLFGKKVGDTDYRFSLIPLGGYVKMAGEDDYEAKDPKPDEFSSKNRSQKIFILVMGAAMNILLAFIIFTVINLQGVEKEKYRFEPPKLGYIEKNSPAEKAGLQSGDLIVSINNKPIKNWEELEYLTGTKVKDSLQIVYQRQGRQLHTQLTVSAQEKYDIGYAGWSYGFMTRIEGVEQGSAAQKAGLKSDDEILAVDQKPVYFRQITSIIEMNAGKQIELSVQRNKEKLNIRVVPELRNGVGKIGVMLRPIGPTMIVRYGLFGSMAESGKSLLNMTTLLFQVLHKMISGKISAKNLSGPIEIAKFSQKAMESGISYLFMLIAAISIQLGVINLFPIPVLDGGHLLIYTVEAIIRRDLSPKLKTILMNIGFVFLIALMVFVILNDIAKTLPKGWGSLLPFLK